MLPWKQVRGFVYGGVEKCLDVHGRLGCGRCEGRNLTRWQRAEMGIVSSVCRVGCAYKKGGGGTFKHCTVYYRTIVHVVCIYIKYTMQYFNSQVSGHMHKISMVKSL